MQCPLPTPQDRADIIACIASRTPALTATLASTILPDLPVPSSLSDEGLAPVAAEEDESGSAMAASGPSTATRRIAPALPLLLALAVCEEADGCSGADLAALVTTAGIAAAKEALAEPSQIGAVITARHVAAAAASLRPSVSARDRAAYEAVYAAFEGHRQADCVVDTRVVQM
jgi:SpoVK/Ycf46/Vps4 family AAA+-type ATPase